MAQNGDTTCPGTGLVWSLGEIVNKHIGDQMKLSIFTYNFCTENYSLNAAAVCWSNYGV